MKKSIEQNYRATKAVLRIVVCLSIMIAASTFDCIAEVRTLKGTIENDPGSEITIKLKRLGGEPFRINKFSFKDVSFRCSGSTPSGKISGDIGRMLIKNQTNPFTQRGKTFVYSSRSGQLTQDGQIGVFILGITNKKCRKSSGNFGISFGDGCSEGGIQGFKKFNAN